MWSRFHVPGFQSCEPINILLTSASLIWTLFVFSCFKSKDNWLFILVWCIQYSTQYFTSYKMNSRYHLSPYKIITVLLTIVPMLYITSLWLIYFIAGNLYFNLPYLFHSSLFLPPLWQAPVCSLSESAFVFIFVCFLDSTYKWKHVVFVFLLLTCFT